MKHFSRLLALFLAVLMSFCCVSCGDKSVPIEEVYGSESQVYVAVEKVKGKTITAVAGKFFENTEDEQEVKRTFYDNGKKVRFKIDKDVYLVNEKNNTKAELDRVNQSDVLLVELDNGEVFLVTILDNVIVKKTNGQDENYSDEFEPDTSTYPDDNGKIGNFENIVDKDGFIDNKSFTTTKEDTNALRIDGAKVTLSNLRIEKSSDCTKIDNGRLYGLNSALLIRKSAQLKIKDSQIVTDGISATGIFANSKGTVALCDASVISVLEKQSYAAAASSGAILHLKNSSLSAQNASSAGIYAGVGGRIKVEDCEIIADAKTSPALITAGIVKAYNSSFTSRSTESVVVSSGGQVYFKDCNLKGSKDDFTDIKNRDLYSVYLYGDKAEPAVISMDGGSIADTNFNVFRVSGTDAEISINKTQIGSYGSSLIKVTDGGSVSFSAANMLISPKFDVEDGCSISVTVKNGCDMSAKLGDVNSLTKASLKVEDGGRFNLTADTYLESFEGDYANVEFGGYKLFVAGKEVVKNGN